MAENNQGSQIIKYEKVLKSKPKSVVFAPLAEAYCDMGIYDKAMQVLKRGIRYNPNYIPGYVALARAYQLQGEGQLAYTTLRPLVSQNRDNIKLQYLFAEISNEVGSLEDALDTYKYLQFLNTNDSKLKDKIKELEDAVVVEPVHTEEVKFDVDGISDDIEEWEQFDLSTSPSTYGSDEVDKEIEETVQESNEDDWSVESSAGNEDDFDDEGTESSINNEAFFTHTLVKLYLDQGHKERAVEILHKILELKPNDKKTIEMLKDLEGEVKEEIEELEEAEVDDGHDVLSASLDQVIGSFDEGSAVDSEETIEAEADVQIDYSAIAPLNDFLDEVRLKFRDKA